MPNKTGRFHSYSDTSKFATGSALYQIQNGKPKLSAYTYTPRGNKELFYDRIRIMWFGHKYSKLFTLTQQDVDFDAIVDHLALMHIIKVRWNQQLQE